ncbi:MAG: type II toxin-antitoxin system RelE/ParE family toxin [Allosphingosinicella sp.]
MRQVEFAPQARADLIDIFNYIAGDDTVRAEAFVGRIEQRCNVLLDFPESGRSRSELAPDLRSIPHGRYVIFYTPGRTKVRIERILHGARDVEGEFGVSE